MKTTLLTAHSGCDATPDNSMEFVRYALTLDVDCLEVDIRAGAAGELILTHDASGAGTSLREAFAALAGHRKMKINCDLKEPGLEAAVLALAEEEGVADRLVYSGTVTKCAATEKVDWYLNVELLFPGAFSFADVPPEDALARIEAGMGETGAHCLNAHYSIADTPLYPMLRARGIPLSLWTPSEESLLRRFLAEGVYNITTRAARLGSALRAETRAVDLVKFASEDDFALFTRVVYNELAMKMNMGRIFTQEEARFLFDQLLARNSRDVFGQYKAFLRATGEYIGICALWVDGEKGEAEIEYSLLPEYWGAGLGSCVAQTLTEMAASAPAVKRFAAITSPDNAASRRILRNLGFHSAGVYDTEDGTRAERFERAAPLA
jgi:RimJ/RimL family protein N-acetyltransferase/glycerophosphoryl diester phosphodiesterase